MAEWVPSILLFLLAGGLIAYCVREWRQAKVLLKWAEASERWPTVPGRIIASEVEKKVTGNTTEDTHYYEPAVSFTYVVGGATYTAATISYRDLRSWHKAAAKVVARYPVGSEVAVAYDPNDPGNSVLEPGAAGVRWRFVWIGIGFLVGIVLIVAGVVIPLFHLHN